MATETASLLLCQPCYGVATEASGEDAGEACEVCQLRTKTANQQARIEELEAQLAEKQAVAKATVEREADARPHVMVIGDSQLVKMRRLPHSMADYLGIRTPRMLPRWQAGQGLDGMLAYLMTGLDADKVEGRKFHVLWFGGLHDTTLEDYERASYITKLQEALQKVKEHGRVLTVSWATLPESAHNAEAGHINEKVVSWAAETDWLKVLDLRYISRREGTMEANEAMWTPKGSQCVCESLKKFLIEKLDYTEEELKFLEASAKRNRELRESKEKRRQNRKGGPPKSQNGPASSQQQAPSTKPATSAATAKKPPPTTAPLKRYPPVQIKSGKLGAKNGPAQKQVAKGPNSKPPVGGGLQKTGYTTANKRPYQKTNTTAWTGGAVVQKRFNGAQPKRARQDNGAYGQQGYGQTAKPYPQNMQGGYNQAQGYSQSAQQQHQQAYVQSNYGAKYDDASNGGGYAGYGAGNDAYNSTGYY